MIEDLGKAFNLNDSFGMDVKVKCGDSTYEANKFLLTARSEIFKSMFTTEMIEKQTNVVNIEDLEPEVLAEMLVYIHTGK